MSMLGLLLRLAGLILLALLVRLIVLRGREDRREGEARNCRKRKRLAAQTKPSVHECPSLPKRCSDPEREFNSLLSMLSIVSSSKHAENCLFTISFIKMLAIFYLWRQEMCNNNQLIGVRRGASQSLAPGGWHARGNRAGFRSHARRRGRGAGIAAAGQPF